MYNRTTATGLLYFLSITTVKDIKISNEFQPHTECNFNGFFYFFTYRYKLTLFKLLKAVQIMNTAICEGIAIL